MQSFGPWDTHSGPALRQELKPPASRQPVRQLSTSPHGPMVQASWYFNTIIRIAQVSYSKNARLFGASADLVTNVDGEAVSADLGERDALFALLEAGQHPRSGPEYILPVLFGITTGGCHSACNFGSDSNLMQFEIRVVLLSAPCNSHSAAPAWCRPGLPSKVRSARWTRPPSPSGRREVSVCVHRAERFPDACTVITAAA